MTGYLRGLHRLDPDKHARFKTSAAYGFTFPSPTYPIDKTGGITDFGMDGNGPDPTLTVNGGNPVGDCGVAATPAHAGMVTAALAGEPLAANTMTSNETVTLYFTYEAAQAGVTWRPPATNDWVAPDGLDNGVDLGDYLLWLFHQQLIEGFVKLDLNEMDAALGLGFVVMVGVSLNPQADQQCESGQPWDIGPGDQPDPDMGHAILRLGAESPTGMRQWCTWGQVQPSTHAWDLACTEQAFAILTKQQATATGFPFAELEADLQALGGVTQTTPPPFVPPGNPGFFTKIWLWFKKFWVWLAWD